MDGYWPSPIGLSVKRESRPENQFTRRVNASDLHDDGVSLPVREFGDKKRCHVIWRYVI